MHRSALLMLVASLSVAAQASATSRINLTYLGGSTGFVGPELILPNASDILTFEVNVQVDSAELALVGFDIEWSTSQLTLSSASWHTGTSFQSFAPFISVTHLMPTAASSSGGIGSVHNIGFFGLFPFPVSTNVFLGTLTFHASPGLTPGFVRSGFFATDDSQAVNGAGQFVTPNFTSFQVGLPEPGTAILLGLGLAGLALASNRRASPH